MSRLPPRRLEALPMEATVISIVCPVLANAGRSAVTVTAATFFSCGLVPGGMGTPKRANMLVILWIVNGASVTAFFISPTFPMYDDDMSTPTRVRSLPGDSSRVLKSGDFEDRAAWNTVEVILEGDRSKHLVNGRIVNTAWDIKQPDPQNPARMIPLKSGRILLEAEGSEIWFRDVRIKPLGQTPEH